MTAVIAAFVAGLLIGGGIALFAIALAMLARKGDDD